MSCFVTEVTLLNIYNFGMFDQLARLFKIWFDGINAMKKYKANFLANGNG